MLSTCTATFRSCIDKLPFYDLVNPLKDSVHSQRLLHFDHTRAEEVGEERKAPKASWGSLDSQGSPVDQAIMVPPVRV